MASMYKLRVFEIIYITKDKKRQLFLNYCIALNSMTFDILLYFNKG